MLFWSACFFFCISLPYNVHSQPHQVASPSSHWEHLQCVHSHRQFKCPYLSLMIDAALAFAESESCDHLKTQTRCRCWRRSLGLRLLFLCARSLCYNRWPPGCLGGEGREATSGGDDSGPEGSHQVSSQRAGGKDPAAFWVEGEMRVGSQIGFFFFTCSKAAKLSGFFLTNHNLFHRRPIRSGSQFTNWIYNRKQLI